MVKLYKKENAEMLYWEICENTNNAGTIHWGIVGQLGQKKEIKSGLFSSLKK